MEKIINKAIHGDKMAFTQLFAMNEQSMYKTAWVYLQNDVDIADAMQDTILTCYEKLHTLNNAKYFKTWMTRILINKCNDILRKRTTVNYENFLEEGKMNHQFDRVEWKMLLNCLDEKYRVVLLLYYLEEISVKEIAKTLDMKQGTVLTRLRRGRRILKEMYEDVKGEFV